MKKYKHGELAKEILKGLVAGGFIAACFVLPGLAQVVTLFNPRGAKDRYRVLRTLKRLKKEKLVNIYERDGTEVVEITEQGKKRILEYDLDAMKIKVPRKWNGWWHVVTFDIPERHKKARDAVSRKVRELGLYAIQKSLFISPYPCKDEIDFIGEFFGVRKYIIYMRAKDPEGEEKLRLHFDV